MNCLNIQQQHQVNHVLSLSQQWQILIEILTG